jgi:hypothetical protein
VPDDVRDRLLRALRPTALGDELAPGVRLDGVSSEAGLSVTLSLDGGRELHVEIAPLEESPRAAARTGDLALSYRAGDGAPPERALELTRLVAARLDGREHELRAAVLADAAERVREVAVERLLERALAGRRPILTLSPYVGCPIGCRFCYAQRKVAGVRRLEGLPPWPWGSYLDVRTNAPEVLARELAAATDDEARRPIKLCPIVSDPYPPVERRTRLTRRCLEVLAQARPRRAVLVLSRSSLLSRDADVLAALGAHAGASIPTVDDEVRRHFEPRAAPIAERLAALEGLLEVVNLAFVDLKPM